VPATEAATALIQVSRERTPSVRLRRGLAGGGRLVAIALLSFYGITLFSCAANSAKKHFVLAEKLWNDGKYVAAVAEFEKATARDPNGKLGLQALFRAAITQAFFLSQYGDAIRKLKAYADLSTDEKTAWEAERHIGEFLFTNTEQYDQVVQHYQRLLRRKPEAQEAPEFQFRIGKSFFFLWKFDEAVSMFQELIKTHPASPWAEKAAYEIGVTYFTRGEQQGGQEDSANKESYQKAIGFFESFLRTYPKSNLAPEVRFGIASCLEEMDKLDVAYHAFAALRDLYPSPKVIDIKLARIKERKAQRSR
jgi:TolA-binding protein